MFGSAGAMIFYRGRCPNCGAPHESFRYKEVINCCLEEFELTYAIDRFEGIESDDLGGKIQNTVNNGKVAYYLNLGYSIEEAVILYKNSMKDKPFQSIVLNECSEVTFGRYKGEKIKNLDKSYLIWCIENVEKFIVDQRFLEKIIRD